MQGQKCLTVLLVGRYQDAAHVYSIFPRGHRDVIQM